MTNSQTKSPSQPLEEGTHYYINQDGRLVMTEAYHLARGTCCGNKCLHCPYEHENVKK